MFFVGLIVGILLGVFLMCLLIQAGKGNAPNSP